MTMSLANMYTTALSDGANTPRVISAAAKVAVAVLSEDPATVNHSLRLAWAQKTLADPKTMGEKMIWGVLADPVIQAILPGNPTDAQVETSVSGLVGGYVNA
jgi:hypothetical protein